MVKLSWTGRGLLSSSWGNIFPRHQIFVRLLQWGWLEDAGGVGWKSIPFFLFPSPPLYLRLFTGGEVVGMQMCGRSAISSLFLALHWGDRWVGGGWHLCEGTSVKITGVRRTHVTGTAFTTDWNSLCRRVTRLLRLCWRMQLEAQAELRNVRDNGKISL